MPGRAGCLEQFPGFLQPLGDGLDQDRQDGQALATVIKNQAGSSLAILATSKVSNVSLTGTDQASVTYTILVGGKPALSNQSGVAVYQDGTWKVGLVSFCGLLTLEGTKVAACNG